MRLPDTELFEDYNCYKNMHKSMGRWQVCMVHKRDRNNRKTLLYSKYIMSISIGRVLTKDEEVDHKDGDKLNDAISNLQILSRKENVEKFNSSRTRDIVELVCPECLSVFYRERRKTHLTSYSRSKSTCCSRVCSGRYSSKIKNLV